MLQDTHRGLLTTLRASGSSKVHLRDTLRKLARRAKARKKVKSKRRAILGLMIAKKRASFQPTSPADSLDEPYHHRIRLGAWNTRGWGGTFTRLDPVLKKERLLGMVEQRGWRAVCLADVRFGVSGVLEFTTEQNVWTVVYQGKVAILLCPAWARRWRSGGCVQYSVGQASRGNSRSLGVYIPGAGQRRGYWVVTCYAPVATRTADIQKFWTELATVADKAPPHSVVVIGGDMNAEPMTGRNGEYRQVVGPFARAWIENRAVRPSTESLLEFCGTQSLVVGSTYYAQRERSTWFNPRYGSGRPIDHFLISKKDMLMMTSCRAVHEGEEGILGARGRSLPPPIAIPGDPTRITTL